MHTFHVLKTLLKINIQMALAYRADTIVSMLINIAWLGWELLGINIIFSNTKSLGGWGIGELITLLGVFRMLNILMFSLIWPNTEKFNASVRDGSLDYTLLQPVNSLFMVTFSRMVVWRIWEALLAVGLIVTGVSMAGQIITPGSTVAFVVLLLSGMMIIYSIWILLISLTFWFTKFDNNVTILQALLDAGRYPVSVYPVWLQIIITFIVPIAVATSIPLQALRGEFGLERVLFFLGISAFSYIAASIFWRFGIRRYSGASS